MPRRAQKGINPMLVAFTAIIIAVVFMTILFFLKSQKGSLRSITNLDVNEYIKEGSTLLGTQGIVSGTINEKLRWTGDRGEVISLRVEGINQLIPILIPPDLSSTNIAIGDRFTINVEVSSNEVLIAKEIIRR
ncbi:MAG: hypothetical protein ACJ0IB_00420 [Verrucomicrobiales bacterium]|nr:MAG: hypothetical protein CBC36_09090 [Verrucomicrobiaceae bacterium TMED76]RCL31133.1 MAG: hypothetical protein DBX02_03850 [Verrucomicrobiota bacterium]|tara:strand:+ start:13989 stop:14387 length:399 start_codon:yes stop_codon:yes gene_type:complete